MPIKRAHRYFYPIDWRELSHVVRFDRAGGRFEQCRRPHGHIIRHLGDGRWFDPLDEIWLDDLGTEIPWPDFVDYAAHKTMKVVLSTANLKALCQRCHLNHDRQQHRRRARITILRRRALGDLFDGLYSDAA